MASLNMFFSIFNSMWIPSNSASNHTNLWLQIKNMRLHKSNSKIYVLQFKKLFSDFTPSIASQMQYKKIMTMQFLYTFKFWGMSPFSQACLAALHIHVFTIVYFTFKIKRVRSLLNLVQIKRGIIKHHDITILSLWS